MIDDNINSLIAMAEQQSDQRLAQELNPETETGLLGPAFISASELAYRQKIRSEAQAQPNNNPPIVQQLAQAVTPPMQVSMQNEMPMPAAPMPQQQMPQQMPPQGFAMGGLIRMANGGSPAQRQIEEGAETLERRAQDEMITRQLQSAMSAPMVDPTGQGRKTLNEVMTPQPYQAPSLAEIQEIQSGALDRAYGPKDIGSEGMNKFRELNRQYNPIIRGVEGLAPLATKGGMEIYEAINEFRNRE